MIRFACPSCEKVYKVPDPMGGKPATCTQCQLRFLIPESAAIRQLVPPPVTAQACKVPSAAASPRRVIPVVLEPCPKCQAVLTVSNDDLGHPVTCPFCQTIYPCVAKSGAVPVSIPPASAEVLGSPSTLEMTPPDGPDDHSFTLPPAEILDAEVVESLRPQPPAIPPPPPPSKLVIPRELEPCPRCAAVNSVASEHVGQPVECPFCHTVYLGVARRPPPPPAPVYIPVPMYGMPHQPQRGGNFSEYWSRPSYGMPLSPPPPQPPPVIVFAPPPPPVSGPAVTVNAAVPVPQPEEVEIAPCPRCRAALSVAPADVGGVVECPFCQTIYPAVPPKAKDGTQLAKVVRRTKAAPPKKTPDNKTARFWWNTAEGDDLWPKGRKA